jgi:hypothetical protein
MTVLLPEITNSLTQALYAAKRKEPYFGKVIPGFHPGDMKQKFD